MSQYRSRSSDAYYDNFPIEEDESEEHEFRKRANRSRFPENRHGDEDDDDVHRGGEGMREPDGYSYNRSYSMRDYHTNDNGYRDNSRGSSSNFRNNSSSHFENRGDSRNGNHQRFVTHDSNSPSGPTNNNNNYDYRYNKSNRSDRDYGTYSGRNGSLKRGSDDDSHFASSNSPKLTPRNQFGLQSFNFHFKRDSRGLFVEYVARDRRSIAPRNKIKDEDMDEYHALLDYYQDKNCVPTVRLRLSPADHLLLPPYEKIIEAFKDYKILNIFIMKSCTLCFMKMNDMLSACKIKKEMDNSLIDGVKIKLEFSLVSDRKQQQKSKKKNPPPK